MRVCVVAELFPSRAAPAKGTFIRERIRALGRVCHVDLLAVGVEGVDGTIPIHRLEPPWFGKGYRISLHSLWMARQVWRWIKSIGTYPDVLHGQGLAPAGYAVVRAGRRLGIPAVVTVMGSDALSYPRHLDLAPVVRYVVSRANSVVAVDPSLIEPLERLGAAASRLKVIPNGVDLGRFRPMAHVERMAFRQIWGMGDKKVVLLPKIPYGANGGQELIQAMPKLPEEMTLVVLGDGPLAPAIRDVANRVRARVVVVGPRPHEEMASWYGSSDVILLPSLWEGRPNVVLEALACGIPVVAFNIGGVRSVLSHGENGFLVRPGDGEALVEALVSAMRRPWDQDRLRRSVEQWTWERFARAHEDLYREVIDLCAVSPV